MAVNGSELIDDPWTTIMSTFTDLLGPGFYLIPVSIIAVALYVKTRSPVAVSAYLIGSGILLSGGGLFIGYPEMINVFGIVTVIGIMGLVVSLYFIKK